MAPYLGKQRNNVNLILPLNFELFVTGI